MLYLFRILAKLWTHTLRHPCLPMNALLALRPAKPLGVHFRHPCLACSSRCIEPLYSRNHCKRTIIPRHTPNPSKPRTIPRKSPTPLPPLSKGGGLTAKHKLLLCCVLIAYPRPFYHQTFLPSRRRDCYIPSPHTNPRKTAPSHSLFVLRVRQPHFPQNKIRPRFHGGELIKSLIYKY